MVRSKKMNGAAPTPPDVYTNAGEQPTVWRVLMGTPTLGTIRFEWHLQVRNLVIPTNFQLGSTAAIGFLVADGQNLIAHSALQTGQHLLLLEDDTAPPPSLFLHLREHVLGLYGKSTYPIISGLYFIKGSQPREPLIYRGRGNGPYTGPDYQRALKAGGLLLCDGVPTGCLYVHRLILEVMAEKVPAYEIASAQMRVVVPKIFETPASCWQDPNTGMWQTATGTSDLHFCDQLEKLGVWDDRRIKQAWPHLVGRKYKLAVDCRIRCGHLDRNTGQVTQ